MASSLLLDPDTVLRPMVLTVLAGSRVVIIPASVYLNCLELDCIAGQKSCLEAAAHNYKK